MFHVEHSRFALFWPGSLEVFLKNTSDKHLCSQLLQQFAYSSPMRTIQL